MASQLGLVTQDSYAATQAGFSDYPGFSQARLGAGAGSLAVLWQRAQCTGALRVLTAGWCLGRLGGPGVAGL